MKGRLSKLEEMVNDSKDKVERMRQEKKKVRREESEKVMRDRLQLANKSLSIWTLSLTGRQEIGGSWCRRQWST